ncbi:uncharacterized protein LOC117320396 [Pecten maximus]|uniref:uncharacterized protein LOC117320396 n=1 Tax=Pecten maximus TaxID=6579 RepID=UPI001458B0C7|nr:uncharacterized protein LOC117320396 [Pecten maximus]
MDRMPSDTCNDSDVSTVYDELETQGNDIDGCRRLPDADLPANSSDKTKDSDSDVQSKTESMDRMPSDTCNNSDVSTVYDELETQGNDTDDLNTTPVSVTDSQTSTGNEIKVTPVSHGMNGQRVYDKRQACYYCGQLFAKISEHLENKHKDQMEVARIIAMKKGSKERTLAWKKIRNMGNFQHVSIMSTHDQNDNDLQLIVDRRPKNVRSLKEFLPCSFCLGFFLKSELWRHSKTCPLKMQGSEEQKETRVQLSSKLLLESSMALTKNSKVDQEFLTVVTGMKQDDVLDCIKSDNSLRLLGGSMIQKVGKSRIANVRQKLRELGRLLIEMRKTTSLQNFNDILKPGNFDNITEVVWNIAGTSQSGEEAFTKRGLPKYEKPSLALKLGHSLKKMAEMKRGCAIRNGDEVGRKEAENYIILHATEWNDKISSHASRTLSERHHNDPNLLPLTEDVVKLRRYLLNEQQRLIPLLRSTPSVNTWRNLALVALTRVTVFNKRRGGETGQILLETYKNRTNWNEAGNAEVLGTLQPLEKKLLERLQLVEIVGKRERKVPVILTEDMINAIDTLNAARDDILLPVENQYLFAAPTTKDGYLKGWDALHFTTQNAGLTKPELITSTNMRKYIATVSQIVDLNSNTELEWLANHMGHTLSVHRQYYRLQEQTLELAKVSKLLIASDAGHAHKYAGKSLDNIALEDVEDFPDLEDEPLNDNAEDKDILNDDVGVDDGFGVDDEDDDDYTAEISVDHEVVPKKQAKARKPWKKEDRILLKRVFYQCLSTKKTPTKADIMLGVRKNDKVKSLFEERGWKALKYYVWNLVQQHNKLQKKLLEKKGN